MRKLKIELYDTHTGNKLAHIVASRCDITNRATIIEVLEPRKEFIRDYSVISATSIVEGMITIYYIDGTHIEITRIHS